MKAFARRVAFMAFVLLSLLAASPAVAGIVTFHVTTTVDAIDDDVTDGVCHTAAGACSLRAAVMQSNHLDLERVDIIVPAGLYRLTRAPQPGAQGEALGDLDILARSGAAFLRAVNVIGAGAASTILDGNGTDRIFRVEQGARATLAGLTIRHGSPELNGIGGGGVLSFGRLLVHDCVVTANVTDAAGGGIAVVGDPSSTTTLIRSAISANSAFSGGGLYVSSKISIYNSLVSGNAADNGGGAYVNGTLSAVNTTFSGNTANENGGGLANYHDSLLYNVSIVSNDADHDRDEQGGIGGGLFASPTGTVTNPRLLVANVLVANNTIFDAPIADNCNGTLEDYGLNLMDDRSGCTVADESSLGSVSVSSIGPLQDNGGPTMTHALLAGSEAIDTTHDNLGCVDETGVPLEADQRGAPRPTGARCDVGAFEFGAVVPVDDLIFRNGFES